MPPPTVNVPEEGGPAQVCTEIVSGTLAPGFTATVTLATSDGPTTGGAQRKETTLAVACAGRLFSECMLSHSL